MYYYWHFTDGKHRPKDKILMISVFPSIKPISTLGDPFKFMGELEMESLQSLSVTSTCTNIHFPELCLKAEEELTDGS